MTAMLAMGATPSHALLKTTTSLLDSTVDTTLGLVDDTGGLLLGDGWLVEDGVETSMDHVNDVVGAKSAWRNGWTGKGVDVALIDTGVVPVPGLTRSPVSNGPDLSLENQSADARYLDTYGHGTHMAGIAVGRESATGGFRGVAPDAGLVSLKLGTYDGAVDVSQVIAAIDWVVQHRRSDGLNIRVLNLSYGTSSTQSPQLDPLSHAVENAWRNGIVVVVSSGNNGNTAALSTPATNPYVVAVGAADTAGTVGHSDDTVAKFSSGGSSARRPDLVAPGRSIVSLRDPGSYIDVNYSTARVGDKLFKGSGTSQAAAVVSGAAALLLQQRPGLTPDQVKALLTRNAASIAGGDPKAGAGMVRVDRALSASTPSTRQTWTASTGTGSLEAARGMAHVADDGTELTGEHTILGPWSATPWSTASTAGTAWTGGVWQGQTWTADCWCGTSWAPRTWGHAPWVGQTWAGNDWASRSWKVGTWDSRSWKESAWDSRSWKDGSWESRSWKGGSWLAGTWNGAGPP
ncbi:MAG TPA: S8 family serine peptidase [Egibacteraceae bacterium]|nr:S8 family serine peptidase [Egibacteraceae bacterium]